MAIIKNPRADLKARYKRVLETSLIISLVFLIMAFKYFPQLETRSILPEGTQELFTVEDILHTKQETRTPPPPRPPIPIETTSEDVIVDIEISTSDIDYNVQLDAPPVQITDNKIIEEENYYFFAVEEMPEPLGGIQGIQKKVKYPEFAIRSNIEGKVHVMAFVDENGDVTKVEIVKGAAGGLDEAAMTAVEQTKFKPGKQRGKPVKVKVTIPIVFKLR